MTNILSFDENDANWRRMGQAIRFLSARYLDQPSLEDAAAAVNLSPFHFQRLFTRYVGVSPKNFVGHLTLGHAKADLAQGKNVLDASFDAGLSGPSRLHDLCLKIEAMTPGDYAKGGAGVDIDYGFHACPFGVALVMATAKGVCGLAFGDEAKRKRSSPTCARAGRRRTIAKRRNGRQKSHGRSSTPGPATPICLSIFWARPGR